MNKLLFTSLLVMVSLTSYCQTLHFKVFGINRAVYSPEFSKYLFDDNLSATGDIYFTSGNGQDVVHVYTSRNDHYKYRIVRQIFDNYTDGIHQIGYSCVDNEGSIVTVKFMFHQDIVEIYFFFDKTAIIYSVKPPGRF